MNFKISIIIRTYNEEKHLEQVLESLNQQTYRNFEIIQVDSESVDKTLCIAEKYNVILVKIKKSDFNYSYASNIGVKNATGSLVCFLSGHSVPVKKTYLEDINRIFQNQLIGAIYGDVIALPDGSWVEKAFNWLGYIKNRIKGNNAELILDSKIHPGIFSCSNACARTELLLQHPFAEELGSGGEDIEVAYRIIQDGYSVARIPNLLVMHSHGNGFKEFIREFKNWEIMYRNVTDYING